MIAARALERATGDLRDRRSRREIVAILDRLDADLVGAGEPELSEFVVALSGALRPARGPRPLPHPRRAVLVRESMIGNVVHLVARARPPP